MRWAICNELFEGWSLERICSYCGELGYQGLEIAPFTLGDDLSAVDLHRMAKLGQIIESEGMQCVGLHWLLARTSGLHLTTDDRGVRNRTVEYLRTLTGVCRELGGKVMVLGSPIQRSFPSGVSRQDALDRLFEAIVSLLPALENQSIILALEPLGPEETNLLNTAEEAAALIERIGSEFCRLILDVKAMSTEQVPIPALIGRHHAALAHFHANDPNRLGPGMGKVDFDPVIGALSQHGYQGWVSVEAFDFSPGAEAIATTSLSTLKKSLANCGRA